MVPFKFRENPNFFFAYCTSYLQQILDINIILLLPHPLPLPLPLLLFILLLLLLPLLLLLLFFPPVSTLSKHHRKPEEDADRVHEDPNGGVDRVKAGSSIVGGVVLRLVDHFLGVVEQEGAKL